MHLSRLNSPLETATNVAVLLAAMAVVTALAWGYFVQKRIASLESGLQKGDTLPNVPGIDSTKLPQTLLIAMSAECGFCTESIPFYNKLAELDRVHRRTTQIVALFPENDGKVGEYARHNKMDRDITYVAGANFQAFRINSTPTVILLDDRWQIVDFWVGALRAEEQNQVIQAIEQVTGATNKSISAQKETSDEGISNGSD